MKIKLFYAGVFLAAFLIGCLSLIPFIYRPASGDAIKLARETTFPDIQAEAAKNREVFDVGAEFFEEMYTTQTDILETGEGWALDEVKVRSGDRLLGLFFENGKSALRYERVKIKHKGDEWNVSTNSKTRPRFLIKDDGSLRSGEVETLFSGFAAYDDEVWSYGHDISSFGKNRERKFQLEETEYTLSIKTGVSLSGERIWVLMLDDGETSQIINYSPYDESDEKYLDTLTDNLLWAGDLDHDNKLDFYIEFYNEKGGAGTGLFLSSKAEKGNLVKLVGRLWAMGC